MTRTLLVASPAAVSVAAHAPTLALANGFTYDPAALTPGFPEVTTIRLGERIRMYVHVSTWTPGTLALLSGSGDVMMTLRLDVPPGGTISGDLDALAPGFEEVRFSMGRLSPARPLAEHRMGVAEGELTADSLKGGAELPEWDASIGTSETELDPNFGRVVIVWWREGGASLHSFTGVASEWKGPGPKPDEFWLSEGVRATLDEYRKSAGAPREPD
ncbi:MAG: hypothetical protein SFZ24_01470 [Planctomycetota bacterium]|nr:hypothetical protein [Planctomycetota bacterium]